MLPSLGARSAKLRHFIHKKLRQSSRISRKTLELSCLLAGAPLGLVLSASSWPSMLKNVDLSNSPYRPPPLR